MMNIKKTLSIITSAAISCCAFTGNGIQAEAAISAESTYIPFDISSHPATMEPFEYGDLYKTFYIRNCPYMSYTIHPSYQDKEDPWYISMPCAWQTHSLNIKLEPDNSEKWMPIVEEYQETLDFEITERSGVYVRLSDNSQQFEIGYELPELVEDKHRIVMEMCDRIMESGGIITEAKYAPYFVAMYGSQIVGFSIYGFTGTEEELAAYTNDMSAAPQIQYGDPLHSGHNDLVNNTFHIIFDLETNSPDEMHKMWEAVLADYPDCAIEPYLAWNGAESGAVISTIGISENDPNLINILTAIQEEESCDTDGNGTVEITDATAVLQSYANTAAGIAAASAENPMDVNGDGAVGIDDATFVLTVYAELAAGMR